MLFPPTSRYANVETATMTLFDDTGNGTEVRYLRRRFLPQPDRFALLREHVVVQDERLDHIAALYLGDPEQFWRVCDANGAMRPQDLTTQPGRWLRITLPEGLPGAGGPND